MNDAFQSPAARVLPERSTSSQTYAIVALLLVAMCLERSTHYGVASILPVWLVGDLRLSAQETYVMRHLHQLVVPITTIVAGILALYVGSYRIFIAGAALSAVAYLGLTTAGAIPLWLCLGLVSVGAGLFKPMVFALAASQFRGSRSNQRIMLLIGLLSTANISGFVGTFSAGALRDQSWTLVFPVAVIAMGIVTVAGALGNHIAAYPSLDSTPPIQRRSVVRALLVLPVYWLWSTTIQLSEAPFNASYDLPSWVFSASILAVLLAGLAAVAALALLAADHIQVNEVPWMGSVLIATALFAIPMCWPIAEHSDTVQYGLYYAIALSQGIMPALVLSWLTRDLPLRVLPLLVAIQMFTGGWGYFGVLGLSALLPPAAVLPVVISLCGLTGLVLLRLPIDPMAD